LMLLIELEQPPEVTKLAALLAKDCKPFLQQINNDIHTYTMFRGVTSTFRTDINIIKCPVNRRSRDTDSTIHHAADDFFFEKFGVRYRSNALFVTGDLDEAGNYGSMMDGKEYIIFPRGAFKFCWSPKVQDFYAASEGSSPRYDGDDEEELTQLLFHWLETLEYKNTDLPSAINSRNEIMLHCTTAYAVDASEMYELLPMVANLLP
jgi:hypothetical protein